MNLFSFTYIFQPPKHEGEPHMYQVHINKYNLNIFPLCQEMQILHMTSWLSVSSLIWISSLLARSSKRMQYTVVHHSFNRVIIAHDMEQETKPLSPNRIVTVHL